jgi:hypothetical protein
VLPIKTTEQVPAEVVQIGIDDCGNPYPLFVVAENLTVANYGDVLARLRIDNIAVEHVFSVLRVRCEVTTPNSPRCSGWRAIVRLAAYATRGYETNEWGGRALVAREAKP